LAVQMPDNADEPSHLAMRAVAESGPWADRLRAAEHARTTIGSFDDYYRLLRQVGCTADLWRTTYVHPLAGAPAIVEWFKSTGLKPYLDLLPDFERDEFLARYQAKMSAAYPPQPDGKVLLRFPRLFIVASRLS
jgi:trans-aconitate 2-methyltransferase